MCCLRSTSYLNFYLTLGTKRFRCTVILLLPLTDELQERIIFIVGAGRFHLFLPPPGIADSCPEVSGRRVRYRHHGFFNGQLQRTSNGLDGMKSTTSNFRSSSSHASFKPTGVMSTWRRSLPLRNTDCTGVKVEGFWTTWILDAGFFLPVLVYVCSSPKVTPRCSRVMSASAYWTT